MLNFISTAQLKKTLIAHSNPKAPNSYCPFIVEGKKKTTPEILCIQPKRYSSSDVPSVVKYGGHFCLAHRYISDNAEKSG